MDDDPDSRKTTHEHIPTGRDLEKRRALGSEVKLNERTLDQVETGMSQADIDNLSSHRFEDPGRRRIHAHGHNGNVDYEPAQRLERLPRGPDRTPHELFVEMDELVLGSNSQYEWKQKARWIKFEEDVLEGAERWGKPHVSSLSFHSMLELRKCLEDGALLLDLDASDLQSIANAVADEMVAQDQLHPSQRGKVINNLLLKHTFTGETGAFMRRNSHAYVGLMDLEEGGPPEPHAYLKGKSYRFSLPFIGMTPGAKTDDNVTFVNGSSTEGYVNHAMNIHGEKMHRKSIHVTSIPQTQNQVVDVELMKKIPKGAQTTSVLVGQVDYLKKPTMAFVRLNRGRYLGNFTQVPLPVRFVFILLGPPNSPIEYTDVGRAISTLMSNKKFNEVAFEARERSDLLNALNEFLDDSLVLPPGELDKKTLLPVLNMAKEKDRARRRRRTERQAAAIKEAEADAAPPPVDPLARTGRPFGGMIRDMKQRFPKYLSDFKDGLNLQCLSVFFFIYFACLAPAITFGGLLSDKVDKWIGVSEMLAGVSFLGLLFHFVAAQPLLIIGFTGPLLVFEEGLFQLSDSVGLEYISFRVWVGVWLSIITTVVICFEGSFLVRFFTRFTEEIFAALISLIFIIEVFVKLAAIFARHPLTEFYDDGVEDAVNNGHFLTTGAPLDNLTSAMDLTTQGTMANDSLWDSNSTSPNQPWIDEEEEEIENQPNTALLSLILTFSTFLIAYFLKHFRNSKFLGRTARRALGDFGVPIAIFVMVGIDVLIRETYTEKLDVPDGLQPTNSTKRGWLINPMGMEKDLPIWAMFAAVIPALLVFILVFMETMITNLILYKKLLPDNKGHGYHWSMFVIGLFGTVTGLFGLPFMTAATVRSVTHVNACQVWGTSHAPGAKPKLEEVKEQRVTGILVHIVMGVSVLMGPLLRKIPLAVLFGVFLYMGVASMNGVQLFDRVYLLFKPVKYHPDVGYVKKVKTWRMHLYTFIQLLCLAVLWVVKSTQAALGFPFILILLIPLRKFLLPRIYNEAELNELDATDMNTKDGPTEYDSDDDDDIYKDAHLVP